MIEIDEKLFFWAEFLERAIQCELGKLQTFVDAHTAGAIENEDVSRALSILRNVREQVWDFSADHGCRRCATTQHAGGRMAHSNASGGFTMGQHNFPGRANVGIIRLSRGPVGGHELALTFVEAAHCLGRHMFLIRAAPARGAKVTGGKIAGGAQHGGGPADVCPVDEHVADCLVWQDAADGWIVTGPVRTCGLVGRFAFGIAGRPQNLRRTEPCSQRGQREDGGWMVGKVITLRAKKIPLS